MQRDHITPISSNRLATVLLAQAISLLLQAKPCPAQERTWEYLKHAGAQAEILHDYARAQNFYGEMVQVARQKFGDDSSEMEEASARMATMLVIRGKPQQAEPYFRKALQIGLERKQQGKGPEDLVWLDDLADAYSTRFRANMVLCLKNALEIREKISDGKHTKLADTLILLATGYHNIGRDAEAVPLAERAVRLHEEKKGVNSSYVANDLIQLASMYVATKQMAKAKATYDRVLPFFEKTNGGIGFGTILTLIGQNYQKAKDFSEAENYYKKALAVFEKSSGPKDIAPAKLLQKLGDVNCLSGQFATAEQYYKQAIAMTEKRFGPNCIESVDPTLALTMMLEKNHKSAEAKVLQAKIDTIRGASKSPPAAPR